MHEETAAAQVAGLSQALFSERQEARGEQFVLRDFHDRLLRLGLPLPLAREALMPDDAQRHSGSGSTPRPSAKRS